MGNEDKILLLLEKIREGQEQLLEFHKQNAAEAKEWRERLQAEQRGILAGANQASGIARLSLRIQQFAVVFFALIVLLAIAAAFIPWSP